MNPSVNVLPFGDFNIHYKDKERLEGFDGGHRLKQLSHIYFFGQV